MPKSKKYEIVTSFASLVIAGMSGVLYFETTEKAQWYRRASGIGANAFENYFFTKVTIDYLADLIENKKYKQATAAVLVALAAYAPQVFISWVEAPKEFNLGMKIFATSATALAGGVLYAYAVSALAPFALNSARTINQSVSYGVRSLCGSVEEDEKLARKAKESTLTNLRSLREKISVANYNDFVFTLEHENMLARCERLVRNFGVKPRLPDCGPVLSYLGQGVKTLLQFTTASLMVYGSLGYTCDTERSLKEDFHASVLLATILANILMFFQNVLGVKGGFGLIGGMADSLTPLKYGRLLSNDHRIGGVAGTATTIAAPFLAGFIASYSGFTGEELYNSSCPGTPMGSLMMPHGGSIVNYSSVGFNGIYDVMTFLWMVKYLTQTLGSPESQDNRYLALASELDGLISNVEKADPAMVGEVLTAAGLSDDQRNDLMGDASTVEEVRLQRDGLFGTGSNASSLATLAKPLADKVSERDVPGENNNSSEDAAGKGYQAVTIEEVGRGNSEERTATPAP